MASLLAAAQIRALVLLLLSVLGLLCLRPRRGVYIILIFLPFMYYLRRQVLHFNEFASRDPILLFPPVVTIAMLLGAAVFSGPRVLRYVSRSGLLKTVVALLVVFVLQVFNPHQGSIFVGIAGGLYFIVPMLWVFMGLLVEERDIRRIFGLVIVIGTLTGLYGIWQHYFGLSEVELYELTSKGMYKYFGDKARIMSTFAGLGDYSLYIATMAVICFAYYWHTKKQLVYLGLFFLAIFALLWASSRTTILLLAFALISFHIVNARNPRLIVVRGALALLVVSALYAYLYSYTPVDVYEAHGSHNPFIAHTIAGVTHPTEESTFQKRVGIWTYVVTRGVLEHPYGRGLGSSTTAAKKFMGGRHQTVESYLFELVYGSSPVAAILFVVIMVYLMRAAFRLSVGPGDRLVYRITFAILAGYLLGSVFGTAIRDTVNSPLAWLLIGWVVREQVDQTEGGAIASPGVAAAA